MTWDLISTDKEDFRVIEAAAPLLCEVNLIKNINRMEHNTVNLPWSDAV